MKIFISKINLLSNSKSNILIMLLYNVRTSFCHCCDTMIPDTAHYWKAGESFWWSDIVFYVLSPSSLSYIKAQNIPQYSYHLHLDQKLSIFIFENIPLLIWNIIRKKKIIWFMEVSIHQNATSSLLPLAWICINNSVLVLGRHWCDSKNRIILGLTADMEGAILAAGHDDLFKNVHQHNHLSNVHIFLYIH